MVKVNVMEAHAELPASYYGEVDDRNPVVSTFKSEVKSFMSLMKLVASNRSNNNSEYAKGVKRLDEIWKNYKHRLPSKMFYEYKLKVADFLFNLKFYQLALWQGYGHHLRQFSSVSVMEITSVDHFLASYFPEGYETDQDLFAMKIRTMEGCVRCLFELEKRHSALTPNGLTKLLSLLNFLRIMMQAFQQTEHLSWQLYNASMHIYNISRYLMTMNHSPQALEYLLWASISLELSVPLMNAKYLPWIVTLYCAVCHCFYDKQKPAQAESFAKRAMKQIKELEKLEQQGKSPVNKKSPKVFKEEYIKLEAMIFKRSVFESRRKPKLLVKGKSKKNLKDIPNVPWPRNSTERMLMDHFDGGAAQFLGIIEALWESSTRPRQTRVLDEPEQQEVVVELLSAGISILAGVATTEQRSDAHLGGCLYVVVPKASLLELAIAGESKVSIKAAVRFIKLLYQYKKPHAFIELSTEMMKILSSMPGVSYRKAETELSLLVSVTGLMAAMRSRLKESEDRIRCPLSETDEFVCLVDSLHKHTCGTTLEAQPDGDLVLDVLLFLWRKIRRTILKDLAEKPGFTSYLDNVEKRNRCLWSLFKLCEMASANDLATVNCTMMTEIIYTLVKLLEAIVDSSTRIKGPVAFEVNFDGVPPYPLSLTVSSRTEMLQRICKLAKRAHTALEKGITTLLPPEHPAVTDLAFMQKGFPLSPSTPPVVSASQSEDGTEEDKFSEDKDAESLEEADIKASRDAGPTSGYLLAMDLHYELDISYQRAFVKLLKLNAVKESELLDQIKKNKLSNALFLIQKALLLHNSKTLDTERGNQPQTLLEVACSLITKAEVEERRLYNSTLPHVPSENQETNGNEEKPPPPPILLSRTHHTFTFVPAPYSLEEQVCWYQLCGHAAERLNLKVRIGDCSLPGTGSMVATVNGRCQLKVEVPVHNQKYVFAVAAYNRDGKLLGNSIGRTTIPILASMPQPLLSTWAHLAQVAFQVEQYTLAKRACMVLWTHFTIPDPEPNTALDKLSIARLNTYTLGLSSLHLNQLFLISIFIETEINIRQESLFCDSFSDNGPFIWEKEARVAETERMLVAMDLAKHLNNGLAAVQAVVTCYGCYAPLIFHQITNPTVVQVLKKCLSVLDDNLELLKQSWTPHIAEALMHMIACITFYLSKSLRALGNNPMDYELIERGRTLLQEMYDAQLHIRRVASEAIGDYAALKGEWRAGLQIKALNLTNKIRAPPDLALAACHEISSTVICNEDSTAMLKLITLGPVKEVYEYMKKFWRKPNFAEFSMPLLQRTMEEGYPDLVIKWGQNMLQNMAKRDEMMVDELEGSGPSDRDRNQTLKVKERRKVRRIIKKKMPKDMLQRMKSRRDMQAVDNMIHTMVCMVQRRQKLARMRTHCGDERVAKAHVNCCVAQAHLALIDQELELLCGGPLHHRYSQLNPLRFSLAHSGVLVQWNAEQKPPSNHYQLSDRDSSQSVSALDVPLSGLTTEEAATLTGDDHVLDESLEDNSSSIMRERLKVKKRMAACVLESIDRAALHFKRAMVLAHRGCHWTTLYHVCQTVWDQSCRVTDLVQLMLNLHTDSPLSTQQLHTTITQLLTLATDLIMDMLCQLKRWNVNDTELTEEELESSFHYSAPRDDSTWVDLRWVRALVLHTLERLHDGGKWESVAHFAILFNSHTRDRYASIVNPLLIHAQRKLLERISSFQGPAVRQPHHVKTQEVTGVEVTCATYADCQLLSGWVLPPKITPPVEAVAEPVAEVATEERSEPEPVPAPVEIKEPELSMALVRVPLDVEDTVRRYHQALERSPKWLHVLQQSRSSLTLYLAHTQSYSAPKLQICDSAGNLPDEKVTPAPNVQPGEAMEDNPVALCNPSVCAEHLPVITSSYITAIQLLKDNSLDPLRFQALHEIGNVHFHNGNIRAAQSAWSKAMDCALQSSGVMEKWSGVSLGGCTMQQTLKHAGVWGCLLGAMIAAKIAQYILTSDFRQRTMCCLLSAHLYKCVLSSSLAHPQDDILYASYNMRAELLPGVDLFSSPHRFHLDTTITGLNFTCHWLLSSGHCIMLLPVITLYLHFVGNICRDMQRTVEGRMLKIRVLTDLCLFSEAVKAMVQLIQGVGVILPDGHQVSKIHYPSATMFHNNRSLVDNAKALEYLMNCDFTPEVRSLYGSTLCLRLYMTRIQLLLALTSSTHGPSVPDSHEAEAIPSQISSDNSVRQGSDPENRCPRSEETRVLNLDAERDLTPERMTFLLLEGVSLLLYPLAQDRPQQDCSVAEGLEIEVEINLLCVSFYLQKGHAGLGAQLAMSSLESLQSSAEITRQIFSESETESFIGTLRHAKHGDHPQNVEACERIGVPLWLRCRVALIQSLLAQIRGSADLSPGRNMNEEAAQIIKEGVNECAQWGDIDTQALLMVEAAELEAQRGNTESSLEKLQEAMGLLSGRLCLPPKPFLALARATLLHRDLSRCPSSPLLKLTQSLLLQQLHSFGENVVLEDGKIVFSPPGPSNIYLPHLRVLDQIAV